MSVGPRNDEIGVGLRHEPEQLLCRIAAEHSPLDRCDLAEPRVRDDLVHRATQSTLVARIERARIERIEVARYDVHQRHLAVDVHDLGAEGDGSHR